MATHPHQEYEKIPFAERQATFKAALDEIGALGIPAKDFVRDPAKLRKSYSLDKSSHVPSVPVAAVAPGTIELVAAVVKICAKHKLPMTPRGGGTGLEGGCIPYAGGLVIDTGRLQRLEIDADNACVWVGAGVTKMALNKAVQKKGFVFGPDPSSNPCVGGMVSTSGSGMCTLRYGTTRENVISLKVVTPQGEVVQTRQVVRKSSAGLELTQLYIGSEGTLGIVCECCFRLFPLQKHSAGGVANFKTAADAVRAVVALQQAGVPHTMLRCEMLNAGGVAMTNSFSKTSLTVAPTVLMEFVTNDGRLRDTARDFKFVQKIFKAHGGYNVRYLRDGKAMDAVWSARRDCLFAAMWADKAKGMQKIVTTDVCVPLSALAKSVGETEKDFADHKWPCLICAHISDGNYHCLIPYSSEADFKTARALETRMVERALAAGGTMSGEHGVGVGKVRHAVAEHGQAHVCVQETIKKALDPDNLMNPGTFYPSQQKLYPTAHL